MSNKTKFWLLIGIGLVGAAVLAAQAAPVRNFYYAYNYKPTYDRYEQVDATEQRPVTAASSQTPDASLLSAFYGIDDGLPGIADWVICEGSAELDGMPVIFSSEIDVTTIEPGDFRITRASGTLGDLTCLTMAPADDEGELRTALLTGQFGSDEDPPVFVEVIGNLYSKDGTVNFKGAKIDVTPLEDGPSMVLAEIVSADEWVLGAAATGIPFGGGSGCPVGTKQIVRVTWAGGVTKPDSTPADDVERQLYEVLVEGKDQTQRVVTPTGLADLGDGDNNHKLCLDTADLPKSVSFPAGRLTDPRDDLNPATSVEVSAPRE